jgi:transketolase
MAATTGSLGQAISQASGIALGRKRKGATGRVWCFLSDGEFAEGQMWEALAAGWHLHLDNLTLVVDYNRQSCDGAMADTLDVEPLDRRIRGFNAAVRVVDAHDPRAIARACRARHPGKVGVVLCRSDPAHGLELLAARAPRLHYLRFASKEEKAAYAAVLDAWNGQGAGGGSGQEPGQAPRP